MAAGDVFGDAEFALRLAAFVSGVGLSEFGGPAVRAGGLEVGEDAVDCFVVVGAGLVDDVFGEGDDLLHEGGAVEFAVLHLAEFGFPVAGHGGGGESLDFHFLKEIDEAEAFAGHVEITAVTGDVFLTEETFDRCGAGGGGAESAFGHGFAEGVVVHKFPGAFHGGEEGGFREACGEGWFPFPRE